MMATGVGGEFDLYVVDADDGGMLQLTKTPVLDRDPSWSPDGETIAFVRDKGGSNEGNDIYLLDIATNEVTQLTRDDLEDGNPVWSRDGKQIAFVKATDDAHSHIWVMNADGTGTPRDLMPDRDGKNMDLSWR